MFTNKLFLALFISAVIVVGAVYSVIPHFLRYSTLKEQGLRYVPITQASNFDHMNIHAARYRDIVDGTLVPGEIDAYEHRGGPILWPILSATILAPFFLPFESVFPGFIMTDFLFPLFLFGSFFAFFLVVTRHRYFSLFSSFVLMLFPQLPVLLPPSSITELKMLFFQLIPFSDMPTSRLSFLTRDSFIPSGPFFVMMFYCIYRALESETRRRTFVVLGGVFYGLLFYLYFYFWVFATIFLGILLFIFLLTKNYPQAKMVFFTGLTGVIVSVPFWINQYYLSSLSSYADIIARMGVEDGHGVRWFLWKTYFLHLFMAGTALYLGHNLSKKTLGYFFAALALAGIIAYNINVVTGFTLQSDHWGNKVFLIVNGLIWPPLIYYGWLFIAPFFKKGFIFNEKKFFSILAVIIIVLLSTHVIESEARESTKHVLDYTVPVNLMNAYGWLVAHTPKDSVIMTPSIETNIELAVYTHNRNFQTRAQNNLLSKAEVLNRMYIAHKFFGVSTKKFFEIIQSRLGVFNFFATEYNSRALDASLRPEKYPIYQLPKKTTAELLDAYIRFKTPEKIPYRADYFFVGPREKEMGADEEVFKRNARLLYDQDGVMIYAYK